MALPLPSDSMIPPQFQGWEEDDLEMASPSAGSSSHPSGLSIGCVITPKEPVALESRNGSAWNSPPSPPEPHCPCSQAPLPHVWGTIPGIPTLHRSGGKGRTPASTRNSQIPPTPTSFSTNVPNPRTTPGRAPSHLPEEQGRAEGEPGRSASLSHGETICVPPLAWDPSWHT